MPNKTSNKIIKNTPEIMDLWEKKIHEKIKGSHSHESLTLRDSLPNFLSNIADALSNPIHLTGAKNKNNNAITAHMGQVHGKDRSSTSFTMNQMILEYHILRLAIFDVLEKEAPLKPADREIIITSIEQAVSGAATEYSSAMSDLQEQLANTLAHDIRNPVAAAKVSAQLILRRPDDLDNCINTAIRISTCMDRVDKMISHLLDISRIRAGQSLNLEFHDCDFDWLIREVTNELNMVYNGRFILESSGKCLGYWNESGLRRVVENLATNAIKYGLENATITISLAQDEMTATLSLHNQGEHIPAHDQTLLFQPYQRRKSSKEKIGWGIGLAMVKGMIDAHKGTIKIESAKDTGTKFIISIPKDFRQSLNLKKADLDLKHLNHAFNFRNDEKAEPISKH